MPRKTVHRDSEVSWRQTASEASTTRWSPTSQTVLTEYIKATGSRYAHRLYQFPDRPRNALADCPNYADPSYSVSALSHSVTSSDDDSIQTKFAGTGAARPEKKRPDRCQQPSKPTATPVSAKERQPNDPTSRIPKPEIGSLKQDSRTDLSMEYLQTWSQRKIRRVAPRINSREARATADSGFGSRGSSIGREGSGKSSEGGGVAPTASKKSDLPRHLTAKYSPATPGGRSAAATTLSSNEVQSTYRINSNVNTRRFDRRARTASPPAGPLDRGYTPSKSGTSLAASRSRVPLSRNDTTLAMLKIKAILAEKWQADHQLDVVRRRLASSRASHRELQGAGAEVVRRAERQRLRLEQEKYAGRLAAAGKEYAKYRKEYHGHKLDFDELEDVAAVEAEARLRLEADRKRTEEERDVGERRRRSSAYSEHEQFFTPRQSSAASKSEKGAGNDGQGEAKDLPSPTQWSGEQRGRGDAAMRYLIVALAGLKIGNSLLSQ